MSIEAKTGVAAVTEIYPKKPEITGPRADTVEKDAKAGAEPESANKKEDPRKALSASELKGANEKLSPARRRLEHTVHEKTGDVLVRVVDMDSGDVIREIPTEESLDYRARMLELSGLLVDSKH